MAITNQHTSIVVFIDEMRGSVSFNNKYIFKINSQVSVSEEDLHLQEIEGNRKEGYYYVDSTGVKVTDKTTKLAVKYVRTHI